MSELQQNIDKVQAGLELAIYRKGIVDSAELIRMKASVSDGSTAVAYMDAATALLDLAQSLVVMPNTK